MFRRKRFRFITLGMIFAIVFAALIYRNRTVSLNDICPALRNGAYQTTFYWGQDTFRIHGTDTQVRDILETAVITPGRKTPSLPHLCFEFRISQKEEQWILTVGADNSVTIAQIGNLDERTYWTDPTGTLFSRLYPVDAQTGTGIVPGYRPDGNYDWISFADHPYWEVNSIVIQNGHTGKTTYINNPEDVSSICVFLSNITGHTGQSSIGYYDALQTLTFYRNQSAAAAILAEEPPVLEVTFGHDYSIYYGEYGDGYPIRYSLNGIHCEDAFLFLMPFENPNT